MACERIMSRCLACKKEGMSLLSGVALAMYTIAVLLRCLISCKCLQCTADKSLETRSFAIRCRSKRSHSDTSSPAHRCQRRQQRLTDEKITTSQKAPFESKSVRSQPTSCIHRYSAARGGLSVLQGEIVCIFNEYRSTLGKNTAKLFVCSSCSGGESSK